MFRSLLFFIALIAPALPSYAEPLWQPVVEDLDRASVQIGSGNIFSSELTLFRTSLNNFRVEVVRALDYGRQRAAVSELCERSKGALCINANFFDEDGAALGLVVHRGITVQKIHRGGQTLTGIFFASRDGVHIVARSLFTPDRAFEAVQAGPRVIENRKPVSGVELTSRSRRSGVCVDGEKRLVLFAVSSGFLGVSMEELQAALSRRDIDCVDALNLDGGGSSQLYLDPTIRGPNKTNPGIDIKGRDDVPVALALIAKR